MKTLNKYRIPLLYSIVFALIGYLSYCFPLTGDDMTFTLIQADTISQILDFSLNYGNGRYLGNFLVLPSVNNVWLRVAMKAVCFLVTYILLEKLFSGSRFGNKFPTLILLIGMPISIFRQVFVWTSGFQNYFPPVMLLLLNLFLIKRFSETKKLWLLLPLAVSAFISQFFVENSTAFHVAISLVLLVYLIYRKKNVLVGTVYFLFSAAGAVLMMMHPTTSRVENYRKYYFSDFESFFGGLFDNYKCIADTLRQGFFLWILLSLICLYFMDKSGKELKCKNAVKSVLGLFPAYCAGELFFLGETYAFENILRSVCSLLLPLVYSFCVVYVIAICMPKSQKKTHSLILLSSGLLALAIIMPVFPIDSRCVYLAYICFSAAALLLLQDVHFSFNMKKVSAYVLTALCLCYCFVYTDIHRANVMRENYIYEQKELHAKTIVISDLPHSQFLHFNFDNVHFVDYFYYYYEEPGDLEFIITDWNKWINYIEKEN